MDFIDTDAKNLLLDAQFHLTPMTWKDRYRNFISLTLIEVEFLDIRPLLFQAVSVWVTSLVNTE